MGWQDLLASKQSAIERETLPWLGGRKIYSGRRAWNIVGRRPHEFGWYEFELGANRSARLRGASTRPVDFQNWAKHRMARGYLVGDRFVPEHARVEPDAAKLIEQTQPAALIDRGLEYFNPVLVAVETGYEEAIFTMALFDGMAELGVRQAYLDRKVSVADVPGVSPALDLAFRFMTWQRAEVERIRAEEERLRAHEALLRKIGSPTGRRELARVDFEAAARAALHVGGAELLDVQEAPRAGEMIVRYRFEHRRLECVCDRYTLRIIDAGVCLQNHVTGEKGDTRFTLESLPGVIREAIRSHRLVVWRHVAGDVADGDDPDDMDEDW